MESPQSCDSIETVASCSFENIKTSSNNKTDLKKSPTCSEHYRTPYVESEKNPENVEKQDFKDWDESKNTKAYSNPETDIWKNQNLVIDQVTEEPAYDQLHSVPNNLALNKATPSVVSQSYTLPIENTTNTTDCKADSERLSSDTQSEYSPVTIVDGNHVRGYYPSHFYYGHPQQGYVQGAVVNKSIFYPGGKNYSNSYQQSALQQPIEKPYHMTENSEQGVTYGGYYSQQNNLPSNYPHSSNFQQHSIIASNEYPTY